MSRADCPPSFLPPLVEIFVVGMAVKDCPAVVVAVVVKSNFNFREIARQEKKTISVLSFSSLKLFSFNLPDRKKKAVYCPVEISCKVTFKVKRDVFEKHRQMEMMLFIIFICNWRKVH